MLAERSRVMATRRRCLFQSQAQISTRQEPYPNGLEMPQA